MFIPLTVDLFHFHDGAPCIVHKAADQYLFTKFSLVFAWSMGYPARIGFVNNGPRFDFDLFAEMLSGCNHLTSCD